MASPGRGSPRARNGAVRAVKVVAETADRVRPQPPGVVVLIYHRVGARTPVEVDLPLEVFEEQMARLAASGRVITLDQALAALQDAPPAGAQPNPVVVTFDDGTSDFADVALPVMARHGVASTLYLSTAFVEDRTPFPDEGVPVSWTALADALTTGLVTIGSHTHTHALLNRLAPREVSDELDRSVGLIGDRLGLEARHFAYPKAVPPSGAADDAVRRRFASAALGGGHPNVYGRSDPYRLQRSAIQRADGLRWFTRKVDGGMALEETLRRQINRLRYAGART